MIDTDLERKYLNVFFALIDWEDLSSSTKLATLQQATRLAENPALSLADKYRLASWLDYAQRS